MEVEQVSLNVNYWLFSNYFIGGYTKEMSTSNGVKIIGYTNLPSRLASTSSSLSCWSDVSPSRESNKIHR